MRSFTVDIGGPVFVADYGGTGPTVVLLHGLGGSHLNWMSVGPELARTFRVLAPDLPGFGWSPSAGRQASIAANIRLVEELIRGLEGGPTLLMGNSMGGLIALGVAAGRSDLLSGLVLINPALPIPPAELIRFDPVAFRFVAAYLLPRFGEYLFSRTAVQLGPEGLVRSTLARCTVDWRRVDSTMVRAMIDLERARFEKPNWHEAVLEGTRSIVQTLMARKHVERWIRTVSAPTLLMHGARDGIVRVSASRAASDIRPDWEYVEFVDAGHVPMMEIPAAFLESVDDWLAGVTELRPFSAAEGTAATA